MKISNTRNINRILREDSQHVEMRSRSGVGSVVSASVSTLINVLFEYLTDALPGINVMCGPLVSLSPLVVDAVEKRKTLLGSGGGFQPDDFDSYCASSTDPVVLQAAIDLLNNVRDNDGWSVSVRLPDDIAKELATSYDASKTYSASIAISYDTQFINDTTYYGVWFLNKDLTKFPLLITDVEPVIEDDVITQLDRVILCANVHSILEEDAQNRRSAATLPFGVCDLGTMVRSELENGTVMTFFHRIVDKCRTAANNSEPSLSLVDIQAQANAIAGSGDNAASDWISEMNSDLSSNFSVSGIINWISDKIRNVTSATTTNDGLIAFSDNNSLVTKNLVSGMFTGITTVVASLVQAISVAIGGVVGVIGVVGSFIAQGVCKLFDTIRQGVNNASVAAINGVSSFDGYPLGFFQGARIFSSATEYTDLADIAPAVSCEDPFFLYFQSDDKSPYAQFMLKYNVFSLAGMRTRGLVGISNANIVTFYKSSAMYTAMLDDITTNPIELVDLTREELDVLLRARFMYGYCWLLYRLFNSCTNVGALSISFNGNSESTTSLDYLIGACVSNIFTIFTQTGEATPQNVHNNYATFSANIPDWDTLTGKVAAGIEAPIAASIRWALSTSYFQKNPGSLWPSGADDVLDVVRSSLSDLPVRANLSSGHIGMRPMLCSPVAAVRMPVFTKAQFWATVTWTVILTTITAAAVVTTAIIARNAARKLSAANSAKVESAWATYTENPTPANYKAYKKAVKKNNFLAKLTGGTTYSYKGYWLDTDDGGDNQNSSSNEKDSNSDVLVAIRGY